MPEFMTGDRVRVESGGWAAGRTGIVLGQLGPTADYWTVALDGGGRFAALPGQIAHLEGGDDDGDR